MAKRPNLGQISSSVFTVSQLNDAYGKIDTAFDNTLSRDGSTPNTMLADLDMNSNDVINVGTMFGDAIDVTEAYIGGKLFTAYTAPTESIIIAVSDESTALTTGTTKVTFRMPYAFTVTAVRASLKTAQTSGSIFTVDINEGGTSILSTKLTIDNTEKTSTTATTAAVISDSTLADDSEITVDIDQVGDGTAVGLKIVLVGHQ